MINTDENHAMMSVEMRIDALNERGSLVSSLYLRVNSSSRRPAVCPPDVGNLSLPGDMEKIGLLYSSALSTDLNCAVLMLISEIKHDSFVAIVIACGSLVWLVGC